MLPRSRPPKSRAQMTRACEVTRHRSRLEQVPPRLNREGIPLWRQMGESIGIDSTCGGRVDGQGLFFRYAPGGDWAG
jgi:hypothetical protein